MILRPNFERAKTAIFIIYIILVFNLISVFSFYFQYELLLKIEDGYYSESEATSNDTRQQFIAIANALLYIVSAITFISWFRRAYYNLHQLTDRLRYSEGWAAGGWFLPIGNLFIPFQIMRELFVKAQNIINKNESHRQNNRYPAILNLWWGLWILSLVLSQIASRLTFSEGIELLKLQTVLFLCENLIEIVNAFIIIKIIRMYSNMELMLEETAVMDIELFAKDVKPEHIA
jgi:hypothetical protein